MSSIERFVDKLDKAAASNQASLEERLPDNASFSRSALLEPNDRAPVPRDEESSPRYTNKKVTIDFSLLESAGMLTPDKLQGQVANEYRAIKRPILKNAFGGGVVDVEHGNLVMISSSLPGEGKTYTSINLAISLAAEMDQTVLLVEADVAKPAVCRYCGFDEPKQGLVDYLLDANLELSDLLLKTNVDKLNILPAGRQHQASSELLGSRSMRGLMLELSSRYSDRIVIFDSPPLLLSNEAVTLAGLMGQVVLVVEAARTQQTQVKRAVELLDPNLVIGVVLNKNRNSDSAGYGYGYGYGYGAERGG